MILREIREITLLIYENLIYDREFLYIPEYYLFISINTDGITHYPYGEFVSCNSHKNQLLGDSRIKCEKQNHEAFS